MNTKLHSENSELMIKSRRNLFAFKKKHPSLYDQLFLRNSYVQYNGDLLDIIRDLGLVSRYANEWISPYMIFEYRGLFIVTDLFTSTERNRVFPLSNDESLFLASKLSEPHDEVVLEIGTGSGIQAICMAKRAKHVVATDINDKALLYARFNANLNAVGDKIEFLNGDVYEKFNGERFNRIVSNSAVIPAPINSGFFVHSDGGPLGIDMSKKIIDGAITHLVDDGKLQMLCTSFSDRNKEFIMTKIIKDSYQNLNCQFSMVELYDNPLEPLNLLTDNFKHLYSYTAFKSNIVKNGYKQLHYLYLETNNDSSKCFDIKYELSNRLFQPDAYSGSWKGRMSRLFLAYNAELMELVPLDS